MVRSRVGVRCKARRRSRVGWAAGTVAPWCAALAMLVSFAADAGQDPRPQASRMTRLDPASEPDVLVPGRDAAFGFALPRRDPVVSEARLAIGGPADFQPEADEMEPRAVMKGRGWPAVDRTHRGDPAVGLRPTFDAALRRPGSLDAARGAALLFGEDDPAAAPTGLGPAAGPVPGPESVARF